MKNYKEECPHLTDNFEMNERGELNCPICKKEEEDRN